MSTARQKKEGKKMNNEALSPPTSPVNVFALLAVVLLGLDFLDLPYDAASFCGPSGYWTIVISFCLMVLPLVLLAVLLQRRFPGENIISASQSALGKPLSMVGNLIFLGSYLVWITLAIRDGSTLLINYFLNRTPAWALVVLLLSGIGYIIINGLRPVLRLAAFICLPMLLFRFLMQIFALQGLKTDLLLPVFSASPVSYLKGALATANAFFPLTTVFLIYPLNTKPQKLHIPVLSAATISLLSFFLGIVGAIGVFGAELTQKFNWSEFVAVQHIYITLLVLEQVGLLFLTIWTSLFFVAVAFLFSVVAKSLRQQFSFLDYRWTCIGLLLLVGTAVLLFPDDFISRTVFTEYRRWLVLPVTVYPLFVYIVSLIRGKRALPNEK